MELVFSTCDLRRAKHFLEDERYSGYSKEAKKFILDNLGKDKLRVADPNFHIPHVDTSDDELRSKLYSIMRQSEDLFSQYLNHERFSYLNEYQKKLMRAFSFYMVLDNPYEKKEPTFRIQGELQTPLYTEWMFLINREQEVVLSKEERINDSLLKFKDESLSKIIDSLLKDKSVRAQTKTVIKNLGIEKKLFSEDLNFNIFFKLEDQRVEDIVEKYKKSCARYNKTPLDLTPLLKARQEFLMQFEFVDQFISLYS